MNYTEQAKRDAVKMATEFAHHIAQTIRDGEDFYPYDFDDIDEYHHLTHVDREWTLLQAAQILDELPNEDDHGLWEGLEPRKAISAQAAYTYGNAVMDAFNEIVEDLQSQFDQDMILTPGGDQDLTPQGGQDLTPQLRQYLETKYSTGGKSAVETKYIECVIKTGWHYRVNGGPWNGPFETEELAIAAAQTWMRG